MKKLQEKLRKKVEQQNDKGKLEEAENLLKEIQKTITEMEKKPNVDKKQVLVNSTISANSSSRSREVRQRRGDEESN